MQGRVTGHYAGNVGLSTLSMAPCIPQGGHDPPSSPGSRRLQVDVYICGVHIFSLLRGSQDKVGLLKLNVQGILGSCGRGMSGQMGGAPRVQALVVVSRTSVSTLPGMRVLDRQT